MTDRIHSQTSEQEQYAFLSQASLLNVQCSFRASRAEWERLCFGGNTWKKAAITKGARIPGGENGFDVQSFGRTLLAYNSGSIVLSLFPFNQAFSNLGRSLSLPLTHLNNALARTDKISKDFPIEVARFEYKIELQRTCIARTIVLEWMQFLEANKVRLACDHGRCAITFKYCTRPVKWSSPENSQLVIRASAKNKLTLSFEVRRDMLYQVPIQGPKVNWSLARLEEHHTDAARHLFGLFTKHLQAFKPREPVVPPSTRSKLVTNVFYLWLGRAPGHADRELHRQLLRAGIDINIPPTPITTASYRQHVATPAEILRCLDTEAGRLPPTVSQKTNDVNKLKRQCKLKNNRQRVGPIRVHDLSM